ncbi:HNH endonuclease [Streptomyces sp. WI03-4A]|uniref:HNH endonuclease n=1 Tax=Streptomyces sp. WI03-4A TaxID=3028706 RepID=UPI0039F522A3
MARRPCLICKRLTTNPSRCDGCQAEYLARRNKQRGSAHSRGYTSRYRAVARQVLAEHRASYGDLCPGWGVPSHASADLTVDHVVPLAKGGGHEPSNLRVLCRGCNARKRDAL